MHLHVRHSQFQDRRSAVGADNRGNPGARHVRMLKWGTSPQRPAARQLLEHRRQAASQACRSPWLRQFALTCSGITIDQVEICHASRAIVNGMTAQSLISFCGLGWMTPHSERGLSRDGLLGEKTGRLWTGGSRRDPTLAIRADITTFFPGLMFRLIDI